MNNQHTITVEYIHIGQKRRYGDTYREALIEFHGSKMGNAVKIKKAARVLWALTQYGNTIFMEADEREWHQAFVSKAEVQQDGRVFVQITEPSTH